jgi:pimeloyl-ACP methyl ester carboxylesterase
MFVRDLGPRHAPPVLFLHGGGVAGWMWEPVRAHLGERCRALVPDLPGHDRSADEPYTSHAATVAALRGVLAARGIAEGLTVVGFSLGAQLSVLLASEVPRCVARVVVVSAQAKPLPFTGPTVRLLGALSGLARHEGFARAQARALFIPDALRADYLRTSAAMTRASLVNAVDANLRFTPPDAWARYPGAAHVLVGARERGLMRASARVLTASRPGSEPLVVAGCGHGIPFQKPEWFASRLVEWLGDAV